MADTKLELVSFKTCPYVQRAVIVLREKAVPFDITYIDLANPPGWFHEISPLGKVPLLKVDGTVLFESAVIAEYLDEVYLPHLHPKDPLRRAHNRAWIEFASNLFGRESIEPEKIVRLRNGAYHRRGPVVPIQGAL